VLATGDTVVDPVPFAIGSYIGEWRTVLQKLSDTHPAILLPGHDLRYVDSIAALLASVQQQVESCAKQGLSLEDTQRRVDLSASSDAFAGQDAQRPGFDTDFAEPATGRAYGEAKGKISDE
jgi:hypothetical protein